MTYVEHSPGSQLSQYIDKIWYCRADNFTAITLVIPLPNHELVFNFSESYTIKTPGDTGFTLANPTAWINGIQSKAYSSCSTGKHEMLGVLFKANGLKAFLKHHSSDFSDNFIDANLVFGNQIQMVMQQLQKAASVTDKIRIAECFLSANLIYPNYPKYLSPCLKQVANSLAAKGSITNICKEISISNKSLIGAFKKYVGISPVKYSHLQSINTSLHLLSQEPRQSLTKLAYSLSFYDQSHFISLFKSVTSLTPSQYSAYVTSSRVDSTSPNFILIEG